MLASHQPAPDPGKFFAFHLESEEGLTASHNPYCAIEEGVSSGGEEGAEDQRIELGRIKGSLT